MFNSLLSFLAAFVLAFSYLAHGAPAVVHPVEDIVFSPAILYPTAGVVWATGSAQNVTWATNNLPAELQDGKGLLLLGHETDGSENLDIKHPLASQFPLSAGCVQFTVPAGLDKRDDYIVVLFGDSGNASPLFTIQPAA